MTIEFVHSKSDERKIVHAMGESAARRAIQNAYRQIGSDISLASITIKNDTLGKPYGYISAESPSIAISISHSFPFIMAAASTHDQALGVDVERIRNFAPTTTEAFLTSVEKNIIATAPQEEQEYLRTLSWSLKESVLKALGVGLRMHPRHIDVSSVLIQGEGSSRHLRIRGVVYPTDVRLWHIDGFVATACSLYKNVVD